MPYVRKTADILVSEELKDVLHQIRDNSEVAKLLLRERHSLESLVENPVNYISFSKNDKSKLSYLTPERFATVDGDFWGSSKRFIVKPGGLIKKIFKDIPEKEVDKFTTLLRNIKNTPEYTFKVVSGEEIRHWYSYGTYANQGDSLGASCMKHDGCQKYLQIYVDNSDVISMLIMLNREGNLIGRAILWNLPDVKVMDRIYTNNDGDYPYQFKKWADENGYIYKREQKWNNTLFFESKGISLYKEISLTLKSSDYRYYPYLDTFKFFNHKTKTFSNKLPENVDNILTISQPDGSRQDGYYLAQDGKTKLYHYHHETVELPYLGYRVFAGNVKYSDINDTHLHIDDCFFDEELRDWIYKDDSLNNQERISQKRAEIEKYKAAQEVIRQNRQRMRDESRHTMSDYLNAVRSGGVSRSSFFDLVSNLTSQDLTDLSEALNQI
jgi:hypothetical protein